MKTLNFNTKNFKNADDLLQYVAQQMEKMGTSATSVGILYEFFCKSCRPKYLLIIDNNGEGWMAHIDKGMVASSMLLSTSEHLKKQPRAIFIFDKEELTFQRLTIYEFMLQFPEVNFKYELQNSSFKNKMLLKSTMLMVAHERMRTDVSVGISDVLYDMNEIDKNNSMLITWIVKWNGTNMIFSNDQKYAKSICENDADKILGIYKISFDESRADNQYTFQELDTEKEIEKFLNVTE